MLSRGDLFIDPDELIAGPLSTPTESTGSTGLFLFRKGVVEHNDLLSSAFVPGEKRKDLAQFLSLR